MEREDMPQPEERGALVPPHGTRPTAVGTATPPPPRPPRRWQGRGGSFKPQPSMWLVLLSLCMGGILIVEASLVPVLALGAILGSLVGLIGFFRDNGAELRWFIVSAVGGAIGGALAARYWGEASSGDATRSATEALVMNAVTGMQIALLIGTLALCVGALFALHWRAWPPTRLRPDGNG